METEIRLLLSMYCTRFAMIAVLLKTKGIPPHYMRF